MLGYDPSLSGGEALNGVFALSVFLAGALLIALGIAAWLAFRFAGEPGTKGYLWRGALVLIGVVLALTLFDRSSLREQAAERRTLEIREAELAARAHGQGSALACLDVLAGPVIESACERALFASPEKVAAAIAYVDAKFDLLAASAAYSARDRRYEPTVARLRRVLGADRFGLVAHMLTARGCNAADCVQLKLLGDPQRVLANMRERTFETRVANFIPSWQQGREQAAAMTASQSAALPPSSTTQIPPATVGGGPGVPLGSGYDFPSAASIPPISIMNAEPTLPPEREAQPPPPGPARSTPPPASARPAPPPRRQTTTREPPVAPPLQVAPRGGIPTTGQAPSAR